MEKSDIISDSVFVVHRIDTKEHVGTFANFKDVILNLMEDPSLANEMKMETNEYAKVKYEGRPYDWEEIKYNYQWDNIERLADAHGYTITKIKLDKENE